MTGDELARMLANGGAARLAFEQADEFRAETARRERKRRDRAAAAQKTTTGREQQPATSAPGSTAAGKHADGPLSGGRPSRHPGRSVDGTS